MASAKSPDSAANLHFSDSDEDLDEPEVDHSGDYSNYSQQMEDFLDEDEDTENGKHGDTDDDGDSEGGFVYTGIDAPEISVSYHDQLRDVLDQEPSEVDSTNDAIEVENSLIVEEEHEPLEQFEYPDDMLSNNSPSTSSMPMTPPSGSGSPGFMFRSPKTRQSFLHPTVSRLRSHPPELSFSREHSSSPSHIFDAASPSPSRFSSMSRSSSISNLRGTSSNGRAHEPNLSSQREVFRWSELHSITNQLFSKASQKASSVLGKAALSTPTVIAANGMICLGLEDGRILVYDFKQTLKAICGDKALGATHGAVTALALSHDHTCVASGHANGHLQLYDLRKPNTPMRSVAPTTMAVVATGRKEGHLHGSRIINIGFIAGRHTALVSADEHGLAFYHSLGKMLFVEAPDILRILGQYPDPASATSPSTLKTPTSPSPHLQGQRKSKYSVLSMAPLPLGVAPHTTDAYDVVALLTPSKLVVVGLRPTPKTWFKCPREPDEGRQSKLKTKGNLAWFPSMPRPPSNSPNNVQAIKQKEGIIEPAMDPILAYSWGTSLRLIRVMEQRFKQRVRSSKTGKTSDIDIGTVVFEPLGRWVADEPITVLQWLHANQIIFATASTMAVYDLRSSRVIEQAQFDGLSLMSPTLRHTTDGSVSYEDAAADTAHALRVYKGKMFMLSRDRVLVGTLLTWADRILSFVESGDFLGAIELCRTYYTNEAPGNRNGLPEDPQARKEITGDKIRSLMEASAKYTFSDDRLTDDTHRTPDHRGVDRTPLFEGLVSTCCRASITLDDFDFLFEDLFQLYDDTGISSIYLRQLEPFILDTEIRYVPPRITQRLIILHEMNGQSEYVERIIWHMDPSCLDLNHTIHLCQKFHLYDALIYIYTRALQDYVAPAVELLGLIRRAQRTQHVQLMGMHNASIDDDLDFDTLVMNAHKIYPYLCNVLSGLSYPSEEPLPEDEANNARKSLYSFLFFGRSSVWPPGNDGKLVLTAIEEGGMEPTYPYARQLLRFDSEAFLHSLDIAFEDSFLNDESQSVNRLIIVRILLEILSDDELSNEDVTFVNIFIARNVPKYPQFLPIAPTLLHRILIGLADDADPSTREDRQLAAEYLLSVYNPHDSDQIIALFEEAGFYRILRTWYRQDRRWAPLFLTYINDHQLQPSDLFSNVHTVLTSAARQSNHTLSNEMIETLTTSVPRLLRASIAATAALVDIHAPQLHEEVVLIVRSEFVDPDEANFVYFKQLLDTSDEDDSTFFSFGQRNSDPSRLPHTMLKSFIDLNSRLHPQDVTRTLQHLDSAIEDWTEVIEICENNDSWATVVWALNWRKEPQAAMQKLERFYSQLARQVVLMLSADDPIYHELNSFKALEQTGRDICLQRSQSHGEYTGPLEDLWFSLLSSQIHAVQEVSASGLDDAKGFENVLVQLRTLVQKTFTALVSITSTQTVSFPRLFKRLVDSTPTATGTHYTEFRLILGGMLESYHSDATMLDITKHLVERDLFDTISQYTTAKKRGWAPASGTCSICRRPLLLNTSKHGPNQPLQVTMPEIIVSQTGSISHRLCVEAEAEDTGA